MTVSEETIRQLTLEAMEVLGDKLSPSAIQEYVESKLQGEQLTIPSENNEKAGDRAILTSFGANHPGVVSSISTLLGQHNCDIQDVSQKIMQGFFTMIMLIDLTNLDITFKDLQEELSKLAIQMKIKIYLQHESVFMYMHRI